MEFKIECPWCNQHYSVDEAFIGQNVQCSVCEKEFIVKKPNDPVAVTKTKTVDSYLKKKKTNKPMDIMDEHYAVYFNRVEEVSRETNAMTNRASR